MTTIAPGNLMANGVTLSYGGDFDIVSGLHLNVPEGKVTAIVGPNGCGKSTLLRAMARLMRPRSGAVLLDGKAVHEQPTKEVAKRLGMLSQQPVLPEMVTVEDLVRRGRYPHQGMWQPPDQSDVVAVARAMMLAGVTDLRSRPVDELSGGQRQRAWLAMVLAQETLVLLLDEPTTYLDIAHSHETLALVRKLNREEGRTFVLVLHDINDAVRYSDHIVVMRDGRIVEEGEPETTASAALMEEVFEVSCDIVTRAGLCKWACVPRGRVASRTRATSDSASTVAIEKLSAGYGGKMVLDDVSIEFPSGKVSAIVGPNACGKSTLLKTIARLLPVSGGAANVNGRPVADRKRREFAQQVGLLSQGHGASPDATVEELVMSGRSPYLRWFRQWSRKDQEAVDRALDATGMTDLRWRQLAALSGGQRQRAWLAMSLAQDTQLLLLDEPTTFLDIGHQVELLDLVREMNHGEGRTVIMVLHDLSMACRYADYIVAMSEGQVVRAGAPGEIVDAELVRDVFGVESHVMPDPVSGCPLVLPVDEPAGVETDEKTLVGEPVLS